MGSNARCLIVGVFGRRCDLYDLGWSSQCAVLGPRPKDDERSAGQRRADGLDELAGRALDSGELPARAVVNVRT
jgi:hypothetical protein